MAESEYRRKSAADLTSAQQIPGLGGCHHSFRKACASVLLIVAAIAVFAGCGSSPEDQVQDTVTGYYQAIDQRQFGDACEAIDSTFLDSFGRFEITKQLPQSMSQGDCERFFEDKQAEMKSLPITQIRVQDDEAIVEVGDTPSTEAQVELRLVGGNWRIVSEPMLNAAVMFRVLDDIG